MLADDLIPFAIGGGCALVGGLICYFTARGGHIMFCLILISVLAMLFVWLWVEASSAPGWDGLGYAAVAVLFVGPAFGGSLIGTVIGRIKARRPSDSA